MILASQDRKYFKALFPSTFEMYVANKLKIIASALETRKLLTSTKITFKMGLRQYLNSLGVAL
jgi:hypothetical protein